MKIYTKTGDKGRTSLASGRRVSKSVALIDAYGNIDELNAFVGDLANEIETRHEQLKKDIHYIQNILFNIGSLLAKDGADYPHYPTIEEVDITYLEKQIDTFNVVLPKMRHFILPSGSRVISKAHICRTVCRRAERRVISVEGDIDMSLIIQYLNRLSDYFFVLARYFHHTNNIPEIKWDNDIRDNYKS